MSTVTTGTPNRSGPQFRLRWSPIDGPELRCAHCGDWWAITDEHWRPGRWYMCRACENDRALLYKALRRSNPVARAVDTERSRRYRAWLRANAPGYLEAYDRERRAVARERMRASRKAKAA